MLKLKVGKIVQYQLSEPDCEDILRRRQYLSEIFCGNEPKPGDLVPVVVTKVWSENCCNGQALLDGNDTLWLTSIVVGDEFLYQEADMDAAEPCDLETQETEPAQT